MMLRILSSLLEVLGLGAVTGGAFLFDWRLGVMVAGVVLVLLGFVTDPPRRPE